jgi:hypothetical protein
MSKVHDLTGQRFGMLTVVERSGSNTRGRATWQCRCDCGNDVIVVGSDLISNKSTSCGCKRSASLSAFNKETKTSHGMRYTRLYREWRSMKNRCSCENWEDYGNYGGRGITVCPEWADSFEAFRDWALANGYRDDLTLDRRDVDGNYEPSNCRWATQAQQANNKRNSRYLEYNGEVKTVKEWADELGLNYSTLYSRITTKGWSTEKALTTPPFSKRDQ